MLVPHAPGANSYDELDGVKVHRIAYWIPRRAEKLFYGGGMLANLKQSWLTLMQVPTFCLAMTISALRWARGKRPDLIQSHWIFPGALIGTMVARIIRVPMVLTVHGSDLALAERLPRPLLRFLLDSPSAITVNSMGARRELKLLMRRLSIPKSEVTYIPMGADLQRQHSGQLFIAEENTPLRILTVGRLSAEKNTATLLEAIAQVVAKGLSVHLTVIGGGPERDELARFAASAGLSGAVTFLGSVPNTEVRSQMKRHHVFASASRREGQGLVFIEALHHGLPVIAGPVGIVPEIVVPGQNGYIVDPANPASIAQCLEIYASDPNAVQMARSRALQTDLERFSWENVTMQFENMMRDIITESVLRGNRDLGR